MPFFAALLPAIIGAGGAIAGSVIRGNAADSAAQTQANAANQASATELQMFNQTQANEQPYMQAGGTALTSLLNGLGLGPGGTGQGSLNTPFNPSMLQNTPGYQFQLGQGEQAIQDSATATGGIGGGNTLKALMNYGQGLASTTYQQQLEDYMAQQNQGFNKLQTIAGSGQNAAANLGSLGSQTAQSIGNNQIGAGNSISAGQVASGNATSSGINQLLASLQSNGGNLNPFGSGGVLDPWASGPQLSGLGG